MKPVAQCKRCNKTITTEEIEIGASLVCPSCDPKSAEKAEASAEDRNGKKAPAEQE